MDLEEILETVLSFILHYGPGSVVLLVFIGLSVAAGLYVFSLFVEERPSQARVFVKVLIVCSFLQTLLCFKFVPWYVVSLNIFSHAIYYMLAKDIPYVDIKSPITFAGAVAAVLAHAAFSLNYLLSPEWHFWRFLLINLYTLWTVPLLILASIIVSPEALVGSDLEKGGMHRSLFARFLKKVFGNASEWVESLDKRPKTAGN